MPLFIVKKKLYYIHMRNKNKLDKIFQNIFQNIQTFTTANKLILMVILINMYAFLDKPKNVVVFHQCVNLCVVWDTLKTKKRGGFSSVCVNMCGLRYIFTMDTCFLCVCLMRSSLFPPESYYSQKAALSRDLQWQHFQPWEGARCERSAWQVSCLPQG